MEPATGSARLSAVTGDRYHNAGSIPRPPRPAHGRDELVYDYTIDYGEIRPERWRRCPVFLFFRGLHVPGGCVNATRRLPAEV